jgi:disulfide oxidoreductase YuzD
MGGSSVMKMGGLKEMLKRSYPDYPWDFSIFTSKARNKKAQSHLMQIAQSLINERVFSCCASCVMIPFRN